MTTDASPAASAIDAATAPHYTWGVGCDGWHLLANAALSVIEERVPAGKGEVRHVHDRAAQFFYILDGVAALEFDQHTLRLVAGQGVHVPAGCPHRFCNPGDGDVRFLVISSPSTAGDRRNLP